MAGSIYGKLFRISTWGESHGKALGVVIDGCPAGLPLSEQDIQTELDRRKPGANPFGTPRTEADEIEILSGVFEGKTTGTPISLILYNQNNRSHDYSDITRYYRPGHADYTYDMKYGFRDYRGGGRSSGRETAARVAAGAVAKKILDTLGVSVNAYTIAVGPISIDRERFDWAESRHNPLYMPDGAAYEAAAEYLLQTKAENDSAGGVVECLVEGLPAGVGEPVFDRLDANLAKAILSIGATKSIAFGEGFGAATMKGSEHNDSFCVNPDGSTGKASNHAGGMLGGISDGSAIYFRVPFKPTASIARPQQTVNIDGEAIEISIQGRHDPIIVPRAVVVVEAMTAITLVDMLFENSCATMDRLMKAYGRG